MTRYHLTLAAIFLAGVCFRARDVTARVDSTSWRESDVAGIARNFHREGMNILYPRIDWRGDGPGFVEMEFPLFPWLTAVLYRLFGLNETWGRILAVSFSLVGLFAFYKLATRLLPEFASTAALAFFALSPLPIDLAAAFMPDGLMFAAYLVAVYAFLRWLEDREPGFYWLAATATALAVLAKASAALLLLFFGLTSLLKMGAKAFRSSRLWLLALLSALPAILWHWHARGFWNAYENSLGLSNGEHFVGIELLTDPTFVLGIARQEYLFVWMETGLLVAAAAVFFHPRNKVVRYCAAWLVAVALFYLVGARTTSSLWARYYHVVAVPPACLLFGLGADALRRFVLRSRHLGVLALAAGTLATGVVGARRFGLVGALRESDFATASTALEWLVVFGVISLFLVGYVWRRADASGTWVAYASLFVVFAAIGFEIHQTNYIYVGHSSAEIHDCVRDSFGPLIPEDALIVASGGACGWVDGRPGPYNASYMFYWLDRKGFSLCLEEQSMDALALFAERGASHFVAEEWALAYAPDFQRELTGSQPAASCDSVHLYALSASR